MIEKSRAKLLVAIFSSILAVDVITKWLSQAFLPLMQRHMLPFPFGGFGIFESLFGLEAILDYTDNFSKVCEILSFYLGKLNVFSYLLNHNNDLTAFFTTRPSLFVDGSPIESEFSTFADYFYEGLNLELSNPCLAYLIEQHSKLYSDQWMLEITEAKETWLHRIANQGNVEIFQLVLKHYLTKLGIGGIDTAQDLSERFRMVNGQNLLHSAADLRAKYSSNDQERQARFIAYLISNFSRLSINDRDGQGCTILHLFVNSDSLTSETLKGLKILFDLGVDPNIATHQDGNTPLHQIVQLGHYYDDDGIAKFLIINGADIYKKNADGESPYSLVAVKAQQREWGQEHWRDLLKFMHQYSTANI